LALRRLARCIPSRRILDLRSSWGRFGRRRPIGSDGDVRDVVEERASPRSPFRKLLRGRDRSWSRLGRRLDLLTFPQGERFLWLGLDRSGRRNVGFVGGCKRECGLRFRSRKGFILGLLRRLERIRGSTPQGLRNKLGCESW
jgi:hypothetical protein